MDNADMLDSAERDVDRLIDVLHRNGLSYWQILKIFLMRCIDLQMQADLEYYIKGGK